MIDGKDLAILAVVAIAALFLSHHQTMKFADEQIHDLKLQIQRNEAYTNGLEKGILMEKGQ